MLRSQCPLEVDRQVIDKIMVAFHETHGRTYGNAHRWRAAEFVNPQAVRSWSLFRPELAAAGSEARRTRPGYLNEPGSYVDTVVYRRPVLALGKELNGPVTVEQADTILIFYPEQRALVDDARSVIVHLPAAVELATSAVAL